MPKLGRRCELSSTAPFGTNDTPTFRPRIIGGNVINVIEGRGNDDMDPFSSFYPSDKPTNVDPRVLTDFTTKYNRPYQDPFHNKQDLIPPATNPPKRPDSKDLSSRYPLLAPIDSNRIKYQQMSTVFEPEVWTKRYYKQIDTPFLVPSNNNRKHNNNVDILSLENNYTTSHNRSLSHSTSSISGDSTHNMTDDKFKASLMTMIPKGMFLPEAPIQLSQSDEVRLLNMLSAELYYADPLKLRDVYLDISNRVDKQLSGFCHYQDLYHTLTRVTFDFPADLLQLVAAMFVSTHRRQKEVNYEKFLSFVGAALKNRDNIKPQNLNHRHKNNNENSKQSKIQYPYSHTVGSPFFGDGGETKLLRMVEEQLIENDFLIDLERLVNSFQLEDRDMRGTLSADQIKRICFQHRIPIQTSLITSLLQKCQDSNKDEQYNWWTFVRLLERVQPARTGLPIPLSKRPLEYAKILPIPTANWPKGETLQGQTPQGHNLRASLNSETGKDLKLKSPNKREDRSWFKNFMKFADALYRQDENFNGSLPLKDVVEWARIYNDTFQLEIPDGEISTALSHSTRKGKVDIHKFLSLLRKQY